MANVIKFLQIATVRGCVCVCQSLKHFAQEQQQRMIFESDFRWLSRPQFSQFRQACS